MLTGRWLIGLWLGLAVGASGCGLVLDPGPDGGKSCQRDADCEDGVSCTLDACNPLNHQCQHTRRDDYCPAIAGLYPCESRLCAPSSSSADSAGCITVGDHSQCQLPAGATCGTAVCAGHLGGKAVNATGCAIMPSGCTTTSVCAPNFNFVPTCQQLPAICITAADCGFIDPCAGTIACVNGACVNQGATCEPPQNTCAINYCIGGNPSKCEEIKAPSCF